MLQFALIFVIISLYVSASENYGGNLKIAKPSDQTSTTQAPTTDMDMKLTENIVRASAYPFESYTITTADGYILELHRIPHEKETTDNDRHRVPFVLAHGLYQDSSAFVSTGENSLAFILADAGYDVWLVNLRGNVYSRRHIKFDPKRDYDYWEFCFHEMGVYDMPAAIDFILSITGEKQVYLLGFSLGGASITVFLSEKPDYNENVLATYLLAPAISLPQETHELIYHFRLIESIFVEIVRDIEAAPYGEKLNLAVSAACFGPLIILCRNAVEYLTETDYSHNRTSVIVAELVDYASSITMKMLKHFLQMVTTSSFAKFDYDGKNKEMYNQKKPPLYYIENIKTQVIIFCALQDHFVNCTDMLATSQRFPSLVRVSSVPLDSHTDFTRGELARKYVYDVIVQEIADSLEERLDELGVELSRNESSSYRGPIIVVIRSSPDLYFVLPITLVALSVAIFLTLYVRRRDSMKKAGEQASLVSFTTQPVNYQANK